MEKVKSSSNEVNNFMVDSIVIIRPFYTYVLISFVIASVITLFWGIFGSIPQRIKGVGELNTISGLERVTHAFGGELTDVKVTTNDTVKKGDVLFVIRKVELEEEINKVKLSIKQLEQEKTLMSDKFDNTSFVKKEANSLAKDRLNQRIQQLNNDIAFYEKKCNEEKQLYDGGLVTYQEYFSSLSSLSSLKNEKILAKERLKLITLSNEELYFGNEVSQKNIADRIDVEKNLLADLEKNFKIQTEVLAMSDGVIREVSVRPGDVVPAGYNLAYIHNDDLDLKKYILNLYIPYSENEIVEKGMSVNIQPFNVDHNLYGWLEGKVKYVSPLPSDNEELMKSLGSKNLIDLIEYNGPTYEVIVELETDPNTFSGFKWTNKKGPPTKMYSGQLGLGYIHVKVKSPIDYVLPIFNDYFR